ncbi:MAG: hypothetical protein OXC30_06415 [Alphaproteobacteria bacterium]|nr:hypothetical protein [Alphaproteobacteria bacterium]
MKKFSLIFFIPWLIITLLCGTKQVDSTLDTHLWGSKAFIMKRKITTNFAEKLHAKPEWIQEHDFALKESRDRLEHIASTGVYSLVRASGWVSVYEESLFAACALHAQGGSPKELYEYYRNILAFPDHTDHTHAPKDLTKAENILQKSKDVARSLAFFATLQEATEYFEDTKTLIAPPPFKSWEDLKNFPTEWCEYMEHHRAHARMVQHVKQIYQPLIQGHSHMRTTSTDLDILASIHTQETTQDAQCMPRPHPATNILGLHQWETEEAFHAQVKNFFEEEFFLMARSLVVKKCIGLKNPQASLADRPYQTNLSHTERVQRSVFPPHSLVTVFGCWEDLFQESQIMGTPLNTAYGQDFEQIIRLFLVCPSMQRMQNIDQSGAPAYIRNLPLFSRWTHSLGVGFALAKKQAPLKVVIAGLLHDVSHGPLSHTLDLLYQSHDQQNASHEAFLKECIDIQFAIAAARHLGADVTLDDCIHFKNHPFLDAASGTVCVDRLEYNILTAYAFRYITLPQAHNILARCVFVDADGDQPAIIRCDPKDAIFLAFTSFFFSIKFWSSHENNFINRSVSEMLARNHKDLDSSMRDFRASDDVTLWEKVAKHPRMHNTLPTADYLQHILNTGTMLPFTAAVPPKNRTINAHVIKNEQGHERLSDFSSIIELSKTTMHLHKRCTCDVWQLISLSGSARRNGSESES